VSDFEARSFDAPRERRVPARLSGHSLDGQVRSIDLSARTLFIAVKPQCDGCHDFIYGDLHELEGFQVVVLSESVDESWTVTSQEIFLSPSAMTELDIRSAPYYLLVDGEQRAVLAEGTLFSPSQVADEIATFLL
jgi:hypothetical protein